MLKAVIFDMDGVMIDSEPVHYEANKRIMETFGYKLEYSYYKQFIGSTLTFMWETIKRDFGISNEIAELNRMSEQYSENIIKENGYIEIPGVVQLVKMLSGAGLKLAVASSSSAHIIERVLSSLGIRDYFDVLVSGENVENPKPAPDIFLRASTLLGVEESGCIVIEDSFNGVKAAKAAKMACIGYINPHSGEQDLSKADYLVESFEGLSLSFFDMVCCHASGEP